jgi:hypothetical protein
VVGKVIYEVGVVSRLARRTLATAVLVAVVAGSIVGEKSVCSPEEDIQRQLSIVDILIGNTYLLFIYGDCARGRNGIGGILGTG